MKPVVIPHRSSTFHIAQISDLHLTDTAFDNPTVQNFQAVLALALASQPDLILLTGDLVNDGNSTIYDWLFGQLHQTSIPFFAIAGNHDVTHEIGVHLPFEQRWHLPITADDRLRHCQQLLIGDTTPYWQILLLDSSVLGQGHGHLDAQALAWLDRTLANQYAPAIIVLHHHPVAVGSAWIDALMLDNAHEFWQVIDQHPHAQHIICGHAHQAHTITAPTRHPCTVLTCPATARQFLPFSDTFCLDTQTSGFRWICLDTTQTLKSYIKRL
ncbi:metallophosphoesterase [Moraxella sp.]|uniref:metallophosphoesterase n=1 Tax=Moraxella sp. TaxID=479 RepID=UPI0026DB2D39|nr:metallophosphoesterase [Moraxella sp.]MDO4894947.1 metallophosphoesterase [Moraxella sp.]